MRVNTQKFTFGLQLAIFSSCRRKKNPVPRRAIFCSAPEKEVLRGGKGACVPQNGVFAIFCNEFCRAVDFLRKMRYTLKKGEKK